MLNLKKRDILRTVLFTMLSILLFIWGSERQASRVNTDMDSTDQSAYMNHAREFARTDFAYIGGRNRMPAYPALMSLFYTDGMSDQEFFALGKRAGIALGIAVLAVAFIVFRLSGRREDAITGTLVAMFTVFAFKSPYFQAEVLYYGIGLVLFYLLLSLIQRPNITTALLAGCLGGIGHLTKASILPVILLASVCLIGRMSSELWRRGHSMGAQNDRAPSAGTTVALHAGCVVIFLSTFLLVISPYILTSKERFGQYFYNVNSTFYMWYDSWEEAKAGTRAHGDRFSWPDMLDEDIPSPRNYFRDHNIAEIAWRLARGFAIVAAFSIFLSYGYGPFMLIYITVTGMFFVQHRDSPPFKRILRENHPAIFFVAAYFLGYLTLYAWFTPIAAAHRYNLSLFLPAMLLCVGSFSFFRKHEMSIRVFGKEEDVAEINRIILKLLGVYLLTIFPWLVSIMYGGG